MRANIDELCKKLFASTWSLLEGSQSLRDPKLDWPGVYLLAYPKSAPSRDLSGTKVWVEQVYYVGMSLSKQGLKGRLRQFLTAIEKGKGHSAGNAFFGHYGGKPYSTLQPRVPLYFATYEVPCCTIKPQAGPEDFRRMGEVACLELYAIGHVKSEMGWVPQLNRSAGGVLDEAE